MLIIRKVREGERQYLSYDDTGQRSWTNVFLDATRFAHDGEIEDAMQQLEDNGYTSEDVGEDGRYEAYHNFELQVYKENTQWRVRITPAIHTAYRVARLRVDTADAAIEHGCSIIDGWKNIDSYAEPLVAQTVG